MLTDYFHPHIGGVEEAVYAVSRRLVERGYGVHVVTLNTDQAPRYENVDGITVHRAASIDLTNVIRLQSAVSAEVVSLALRVARDVRPDVIHTHNLFFSTSLVAVGLKMLLGLPLVTTMQLGAMDQMSGLSRLAACTWEHSVGRLVARVSDRMVAVSRAVGDHAVRLGCRPDSVRVIPNGVDLDRFHPTVVASTDEPPRRRIGLIGRLIANKGPQYIVEAAPLILDRHPDVEFVVVGDGPLRGPLEARVAEQGFGPAFSFLGARSDVADILRTCSLAVRPSLSEGLPLAILEAMASGLPVVATPVGGTPEIVLDGQTGYLIPPRSPEALAAAINRLLADPVRAAEMGRCGQELVRHTYE
jgi:glycosyltransferase involved in cell wall biosynthesis